MLRSVSLGSWYGVDPSRSYFGIRVTSGRGSSSISSYGGDRSPFRGNISRSGGCIRRTSRIIVWYLSGGVAVSVITERCRSSEVTSRVISRFYISRTLE